MHLQGLQLISCYQALCSGRSSLWEVVVNALEDVLGLTVLSASVSQEDFLHMTWAINAVIKLGREFCGSESRRLVSCLALKSREYYRCVHEETFQILKQMIDQDPWVSPRLAGSGGGGRCYWSRQKKCAWIVLQWWGHGPQGHAGSALRGRVRVFDMSKMRGGSAEARGEGCP